MYPPSKWLRFWLSRVSTQGSKAGTDPNEVSQQQHEEAHPVLGEEDSVVSEGGGAVGCGCVSRLSASPAQLTFCVR